MVVVALILYWKREGSKPISPGFISRTVPGSVELLAPDGSLPVRRNSAISGRSSSFCTRWVVRSFCRAAAAAPREACTWLAVLPADWFPAAASCWRRRRRPFPIAERGAIRHSFWREMQALPQP